jgi:hypothetical protein
VGQVTVEITERAPRSAQPEREALSWLLKFIEAGPEELPNLFSLSSGFGAFVTLGRRYLGPPTDSEIRRFHTEFVQGIRAVLAGQGRKAWRIELPQRPASCWYVFFQKPGKPQNPHGLESYFDGSWQLGFLSRVDALLAKFGADIKACPACVRIFQAEHGLQRYCSRACNERHRQHLLRERRIKKIRNHQAELGVRLTPPQVQKKLGLRSLAEARKYLNLANKEHNDGTEA